MRTPHSITHTYTHTHTHTYTQIHTPIHAQAPSLGVYSKPYSSSFGNGGSYCSGDMKPFFPWAPWDDVKNGNYIPIKV